MHCCGSEIRRRGFAKRMDRRIPLLMHVPVPWVFLVAYFMGVVLQAYLPAPLASEHLHKITRIAGAILLGGGAVIAVWCLTMFRRARTTTIPYETSSQLVTRGPYRLSRNPMYVSLTLVYLGEAAILAQIWPLLPLLLTLGYVNWTVIPREEAQLLQTFGPAYAQYRAMVRRWI